MMTERAAGRDLDRLIAEKVMRWTRSVSEHGIEHWISESGERDPFDDGDRNNLFSPSIDIDHAWVVVEHLRSRPLWITLTSLTGWRCQIDRGSDASIVGSAEADTAALAICRAALEAVGA